MDSSVNGDNNGDTSDSNISHDATTPPTTSAWYYSPKDSPGCSPMITHYHPHLLKQKSFHELDCQRGSLLLNNDDRKRRSRSLGAESDLMMHHPIPKFTPMPLGMSLVPPSKPVSLKSNGSKKLETIYSEGNFRDHYFDSDDDEGGSLLHQHQRNDSPDVESTTNRTTGAAAPLEPYAPPPPNPLCISITYGVINALIVLPVLMSFGSIIYRDPFFSQYMPVLIKLTVISGMVHQVCFSSLSGLPFAVGQVQDAGLIFLSKMAADLVQQCQSRGIDDVDTILATVTVGLGVATALLGVGLVIVGQLRLAQYVQLLPTPVIGGYLAFIGYFCGVSGIGIMGGNTSDDDESLLQQWLPHVWLILPGVLGGLMIYILVRRIRHMAVLPVCIVVLLSLFYILLGITGTSIADATEQGWIRASDPPPPWYHSWDYLKLHLVAWETLPSQIWTLLSMLFVVALSSSLDVAAIELELHRPLNYNAELKMVGMSNLVSGLTGGYTGSYIFSQSIFSLRAGITSRSAGYFLALCELVYVVLPVPILSYVPNFFFGSLLVMICVDLMYEWLWEVRLKLTMAEYTVCLGTFGLIQVTGVEYGILLGVLVHVVFSMVGLLPTTTNNNKANENEETEQMLLTAAAGEDSTTQKSFGTTETATTYGTLA